jgi:hypothetical protein
LREHGFMAAIEFATPLGRRFEGIERERQAPARDSDGIGVVHAAIRCGQRARYR